MNKSRSAVILIQNDSVALIERHRLGRHYFAFPGGGVEPGETLEAAAAREAQEELGVTVEVMQRVIVVSFKDQLQHYFLVRATGGEFGSGQGEEYTQPSPEDGDYQPVWMPIADIPSCNILPAPVAALVVHAHRNGWPDKPLQVTESPENQ